METTQSIATPLLHNCSFPQLKFQVNFVSLGTNAFLLSTQSCPSHCQGLHRQQQELVGCGWTIPKDTRCPGAAEGCRHIQGWFPAVSPCSEGCVHRSSMTGGSLASQILCIHSEIQASLLRNQLAGFTQFYNLILPAAMQVVLELSKIQFYHLFCYLPFFCLVYLPA